MKNVGYIKSYRPQNDDELYFSEPFTKWQAWHDLLYLAAYKDTFVFVRGIKVEIKRGQIAASDRFFAERWKWSRGKVERFLQLLTDMQRIEPQKSNVITLISITNYSKYQDNEATNDTTNEATNDTTNEATNDTTNEATNRAINKESKELNKLINQENINTHTPTRAREGDFKTYGTFQNVKLTDGDMQMLRMKLAAEGKDEAFLTRCIDKLSAFMAQEGRTYQNHAAAILNWAKNAVDEQKPGTAAASRYAKPAPENDPKRASREERIQWAKDLWEQVSEDERQDYINRYNCYPWERGDI